MGALAARANASLVEILAFPPWMRSDEASIPAILFMMTIAMKVGSLI